MGNNLWPEEKLAYESARDLSLQPHVPRPIRTMLVSLTGTISRLLRGHRGDPKWEPLETAHLIEPQDGKLDAMLAEMQKTAPGMTMEKMRAELAKGGLWKNNIYTVAVYDLGADSKGGRFLHLSIKRNDRESVHDWRHLQRIKTEIAGPEAEGVELYPAESRVVDMANQYHLWVFTKAKLEFGFKTHGAPQKHSAEKAASLGAKNREDA